MYIEPNRDLCNLTPDGALDIFRRLLWAEASRVNVSVTCIQVPNNINVADGGIDAKIINVNPKEIDLISKGDNGYQVKSSDLTPNKCVDELYNDSKIRELKNGIKKILDSDGKYYLVLFANINDKQRDKREKAIGSELKKLGYKEDQFKLIEVSQLHKVIEEHKPLIAYIQNDLSFCEYYEVWAQRTINRIPAKYIYDTTRENIKNQIIELCRKDCEENEIYRLIGLPGVGKSRLVFEALKEDDLRNITVYMSSANIFKRSSLYHYLKTNGKTKTIVVVDECNSEDYDTIKKEFSRLGNLKIITISHDMKSVGSMQWFELNILEKSNLVKVLESAYPQMPKDIVKTITKYSSGYPRIAMIIADLFKQSKISTNEMLNATEENIFERLIGGNYKPDTDKYKKTLEILTSIAIFDKVCVIQETEEIKWICEFTNTTEEEYLQIVNAEKNRKILQGDYYVYVTPFILKVYLINKWWDKKSFIHKKFEKFINDIPNNIRPEIIKRFIQNIPFIASNDQSKKLISSMLDDGGILDDYSFINTNIGSEFLLQASYVNPGAAVNLIQKNLNKLCDNEIKEFIAGRRNIIRSLEYIAIWEEYFKEAMHCLLALAVYENESYANNSTGIFSNYFWLTYGDMSYTEAPPEVRWEFLNDVIKENMPKKLMHVVDALDGALKTGFFSKMLIEYDYMIRNPKFWQPKTYGDLYKEYRKAWDMLCSLMENGEIAVRKKAIDVAIKRAEETIYVPGALTKVVKVLKKLSKQEEYQKRILQIVMRIKKYKNDSTPEKIKIKLNEIEKTIVKGDYRSLLKRYVGMNIFEDRVDSKSNYDESKTNKALIKLAKESIKNKNNLYKELAWIVTVKAENAYAFGYKLIKEDTDRNLLKKIISTLNHEDYSCAFIGGYLRGICEEDVEEWHKIIIKISNNADYVKYVPELIWRTTITDKMVDLLINLIEKERIEIDLIKIFSLGGMFKDLNNKSIIKWLEMLLKKSSIDTISMAVEVCFSYYVYDKNSQNIPYNLMFKILTHDTLLNPKTKCDKANSNMVEYYWEKTSKFIIERYPDKAIDIAKKIINSLGNENSIFNRYSSDIYIVLSYVTSKKPNEIWDIISTELAKPMDKKQFFIRSWLRGSNVFEKETGAILLFKKETVFNWIDKDVAKRAWYIASIIPKDLSANSAKCWTTSILNKYGDREDVRSNLSANYSTEGFSGKASLYYKSKKDKFGSILQRENNPKVKKWLKEYIKQIEYNIKRETIAEERDDRY